MSIAPNPFRLTGPLRRIPTLGPWMLNMTERALAFERLANIHRQLQSYDTPGDFAHHALQLLQVEFELDPADIERIPAAGSAIVVANHPYGGLEGLYLIALLLRVRRDAKLIVNEFLYRIPELRDVLIPVNAFGGQAAAKQNALSLRKALRHVRDGGLLMMFPAGEVSHLHLSANRVCDPPWSPIAARLVRLSGAPVLPINFGGGNSLIFQMAGLLHPRARTALLSRELLNKRRHRIAVAIGRPLAPTQLAAIEDDAALASFMRLSTYALAVTRATTKRREPDRHADPIAAPIGGRRIAEEVEDLFATQTLARNGELRVIHARTEQIPWTLRELGRLRELTFRAVGEGTGQARDLDRFDAHYTHLILWHEMHAEIAGAYRIGHVDELMQRFGRAGLYTHTLFEYGNSFLERLGPALELGRSFVRTEYQKTFAALLLLWRGIAAYVAGHPQYRVLFGPVSISADYRAESRALLMQHLRRHHSHPQLSRLIHPRRPCKHTQSLATLDSDWPHLHDLDAISSLLARMETDGKGVPILLRQYLKLNGKIVGFNLDAAFDDAIDGLIVVDLAETDPLVLKKYMGAEASERYLARHKS